MKCNSFLLLKRLLYLNVVLPFEVPKNGDRWKRKRYFCQEKARRQCVNLSQEMAAGPVACNWKPRLNQHVDACCMLLYVQNVSYVTQWSTSESFLDLKTHQMDCYNMTMCTTPTTNGWNPKIGGLGRCFFFSVGVMFSFQPLVFGRCIKKSGFKGFIFSLLPGKMIQFDGRIFFQMVWFNHQLARRIIKSTNNVTLLYFFVFVANQKGGVHKIQTMAPINSSNEPWKKGPWLLVGYIGALNRLFHDFMT